MPDPALTMTRKESRNCGENGMGKHFQSIDSQVLSRIYGHGGGGYSPPKVPSFDEILEAVGDFERRFNEKPE